MDFLFCQVNGFYTTFDHLFFHRLRNFGCASESLCFIANGSLDIMYDYGLHVWDVAAGVLLVEEAGGVVLDPNGKLCL